MKTPQILLLLSGLFLLLAACNPPLAATADNADNNNSMAATDEAEKSKPSEPLKVSFDCREIQSMEDINGPRTIVSVVVNGAKTLIDTVSAAQPFTTEDYAQYGIPKEALAGCGGWFAGGGDYFYADVDGDNVVVFAGWQDEGQDDEGYHWEMKQVVPLK